MTLIILFFLSNLLLGTNCDYYPIVETSNGPIQGVYQRFYIDHGLSEIEAFLGIPFAEPPLGLRRFEPPEPLNSTWNQPYQATQFRAACFQNPTDKNPKISEDCLYLNIWRPKVTVNRSEYLPVYYHIHGAAYIKNSGATPDYRGDILTATQNIITVNSNYRLGAFGFAYGSPDRMPGNSGLYDVLLTLRWIQNNIRAFGGDPNRVTLTGLSSGGKMATVIASLPEQFKSRSLFSRMILMSGASTDNQQVESKEIGVAKTRLLASKVNCLSQFDTLNRFTSRLSAETINCLKDQSADTLLRAQNSQDITAIGATAEAMFLPVYGTQLIPDPAMVNNIKSLNNSIDVPMLFGSEQDESKPFPSLKAVKTLDDAYNYTRAEVTFDLKNVSKDFVDSVFHKYFDGADPNDVYDLRSRCINLTSDVNFNCPSLILSELFSLVSGNIRLYLNTYSGQALSRPYGTQHSDDQKFGQGAPYRERESFAPKDRQFSSIMMKIYGDFVKGIPLEDWPSVKYNGSDPSRLQPIKILSLESTNGFDYRQKYCLDWAEAFGYQIP